MFARTTSFAVSSRAIYYGTLHGARILQLQEQISSGSRISLPSDGPLQYQRIAGIRNRLGGLEAADAVINDANSRLNASVSELQEANRLVASAARLAQQGIQALGPAERAALATEAEGLLVRLRSLANSQAGNQYLFGGTRGSSPPFAFENPATAGRLATTRYSGGERNATSVLSSTVVVDSLYAGNQVFQVLEREPTVILSRSGATSAETPVDTMTGRAILQVRHSTTTYAPGSGIQASIKSPGNDTLLGPPGTHRVTITDTSGTGAAGTISLNGAAAVAWDSSMDNLVVTGPQGEIVHVDMTAITAGFDGDVAISIAGTFSLDGGATTTPIDWTGVQTLTDPVTGGRLHLNTATIRRPGDDHLEFPGTTDVFATLDALIRDLRSERPVSQAELNGSLGRTLDRLQRLGDRLLGFVGIQSSTLAGLEQISFRSGDLKLELQTEQSGLQSTDLASAVIELQQQQLLQQYTWTVTARIMSQSLLNFLS